MQHKINEKVNKVQTNSLFFNPLPNLNFFYQLHAGTINIPKLGELLVLGSKFRPTSYVLMTCGANFLSSLIAFFCQVQLSLLPISIIWAWDKCEQTWLKMDKWAHCESLDMPMELGLFLFWCGSYIASREMVASLA